MFRFLKKIFKFSLLLMIFSLNVLTVIFRTTNFLSQLRHYGFRPDWVNVEDYNPKEFERVLIIYVVPTGNVYVGAGQWNTNGWYIFGHNADSKYSVLYWAHFPKSIKTKRRLYKGKLDYIRGYRFDP